MFEALQVSEALGAAGAPPGELPGFSQYPILQLFGGIISLMVVGLSALAFLRAPPAAKPAEPKPAEAAPRAATAADAFAAMGDGSQLFLQGPVKDLQEKAAALLVAVEKVSAMNYETREQVAQGLQLTRHDIRGAIGEDAIEASRETGELKRMIAEVSSKIDVVSRELALVHGFISGKLK